MSRFPLPKTSARAVPPLELALNWIKPPAPPPVPPLAIRVAFPAVALLLKLMLPWLPAPSMVVTKFCVVPELFVMPTPLIVSVSIGGAVIVKALAPGLNWMPLTSVGSEMEMPVVLETPNWAVSAGPFGTVAGVQLAAVFQSPLAGLRFHVALPAKAVTAVIRKKTSVGAAASEHKMARRRQGEGLSEVLTVGIVSVSWIGVYIWTFFQLVNAAVRI